MRITIVNPPKVVTYNNLKIGASFMYEGILFLKLADANGPKMSTPLTMHCALRMNTGNPVGFYSDSEVKPVEIVAIEVAYI